MKTKLFVLSMLTLVASDVIAGRHSRPSNPPKRSSSSDTVLNVTNAFERLATLHNKGFADAAATALEGKVLQGKNVMLESEVRALLTPKAKPFAYTSRNQVNPAQVAAFVNQAIALLK